MTTITITLDDELAARVEAEACRRNVTVEELAAQSLQKELLTLSDTEFECLADRVFEEDRELLRRLA
jgi:predicted transcriptional regulator